MAGIVRPQVGRVRVVHGLLGLIGMVLGLWLAAACTAAPPSASCTINWTGPSGGDFGAAANWDLGRAPGATDRACAPTGSSVVVTGVENVASVALDGALQIAPAGSLRATDKSSVGDLTLNGTMDGLSTITFATFHANSGGVLTGAGTTNVTGAATIDGAVTLRNGRVLSLGGSTTLSGAAITVCDDALAQVVGTTQVTAPSTVDGVGCATPPTTAVRVEGEGTLDASSALVASAPIDNQGRVRVRAGVTMQTAALTQGAGSFDVESAATTSVGGGSGTFTVFGGTVRGSGQIAGSLTLLGATLAPGPENGIGTFSVTGAVTANSTAHVALDVGGTAPGTQLDTITSTGAVSLGSSTLDLTLTGGYVPTSGTNLEVLTAASRTGTFGSVIMAAGTGHGISPLYTATGVTLRTTDCDADKYHPGAYVPGYSLGSYGPLPTLNGLDLRGCDLTGSYFQDTIEIKNANLAGASFRGSYTYVAKFDGSDLTGADLTGLLQVAPASFTGVTWSHTICPDGTNSDANGGTCIGHTAMREYTVNTTADFPDAYPGDGVCGTGSCSLRAAIMEANAKPGGDWINASGGPYLLNGAGPGEDAGKTGDLDITSSMMLWASVTIDGGGGERVFDIRPGGSLYAAGVTVKNAAPDALVRVDGALMGPMRLAATTGPALTVNGSAILLGAQITGSVSPAIDNRSWLYFNGSIDGAGVSSSGVIETRATFKNAAVGLTNTGRAKLTSTTFDHNGTAVRNSGAMSIDGATFKDNVVGLDNDATFTGTRLSVTGSTGVGLDNAGALTLDASSFDGNAAAIWTSGDAAVTNLTVSGGVGSSAAVDVSGGTATLRQATISANAGGGVSVEGAATFLDSTFDANGAFSLRVNGGSASVLNTVLRASDAGSACVGTPTSLGWNLASDGSCGLAGTADLQGVDPKLRPLAVSGATAQLTQQLEGGSPAVDSGRSGCTGPDARGLVRPVDGDGDGTATCDRGAVEMPTYRPLHLVVDAGGGAADATPGDGVCATVAGQCTLQAAFAEATASWGEDVIDLTPGRTDYYATGTVQSTVTVHGNGAALSFGQLTFTGDSAVAFDRLTILSGNVTNSASTFDLRDSTALGLNNTSSMTVTNAQIQGATNAGQLAVDRSMISSNGGFGVKSTAGSTTTLTASSISGTGRALMLGGPATIQSSMIIDNGQGGLQVSAPVSIADSTISGNRYGGIQSGSSLVSLVNSIVADQASGADCDAPVQSVGWNLSSDSSCGLTQPSDLANQHAGLGPAVLPDGGLPVRVPLAGSPAIDSGRPGCSGLDVRGVTRPVDGDGTGGAACDRGPLEARPFRTMAMTVTSNLDAVDAAPGDGVCQTTVVGECTLRAAIMEANFGPTNATITLQPNATYPVTLQAQPPNLAEDPASWGDLDVLSHVVLHASGSTISTLHAWGSTNLAVDHAAMPQSSSLDGSFGRLVVTDSTVQGASGITSTGSIDVSRVTFATYTSPIGQVYGPGFISAGGPTTIQQTDVGQIHVAAASVTSVADTNVAILADSAGSLTMDRSTIGAVEVTGGSTVLRNTTVLRQDLGDAISATGGSLSIQSSTISHQSDAGIRSAGGTVTMLGSIVTTDGVMPYNSRAAGPDCVGPVQSAGWNIASDASCTLSGTSDLNATDPSLGPVGHNGGTMLNRLPTTGSPAIDAGPATCGGTDQRSRPRVVDGDANSVATCDRGAVEAGVRRNLNLVVNGSSDTVDVNPGNGLCAGPSGFCNLRAAVMEANATNGVHTITLPAGYTFTLKDGNVGDDDEVSGDLDVAAAVTINANGAVLIRSGGPGSIETYGTQPVSIVGLNGRAYLSTITNRHADLRLTDDVLGGLWNGGTVTMARGEISGAVSNFGRMTLTDASVLGSQTIDSRGPVSITRSFVEGGISERGAGNTLTIVSSTVKGGVGTNEEASGTITDSTVGGRLGRTAPAALQATSSVLIAGCDTAIESGGWNVAAGTACGLGAAGDLQGVDVRMGPLDDYGGPTKTYLPLEGSPAIDGGKPGCSGTDQRGQPRPRDGDGDGVAQCDRGSVETGPPAPLSIVVNSTGTATDAKPGDGICSTASSGECTLAAAIRESNVTNGPDVITLQAGATYTASERSLSTVTIHGSGATLSGVNLELAGTGAARVDSLTIRGSSLALRSWSADAQITGVTIVDAFQTGIENWGTMVVRNSRLQTVTTPFYPPTVLAIRSYGSLTVLDTTVDMSAAPLAADLYAEGPLLVSRSTFVHSSIGHGVSGTFALDRVTVSGGGVYAGTGSDGAVIDSSTLVGAPVLSNGMPSSTIGAPGGITLHNSIVVGPAGTAVCSGTIVSTGYNLTADSTCALAQPTDLQGVSPSLGALADNGGPTKTFLPATGSPAIDSGDPTCTGTDQRGVARPQGGGCDRGAVEQ
jgi:CSLREA domain-containing protein